MISKQPLSMLGCLLWSLSPPEVEKHILLNAFRMTWSNRGFDMDTDAWNRLAKKTKRIPFFFFGPVTRPAIDGFDIGENPGRFVSILCGVIIGVLFLTVLFLSRGIAAFVLGGVAALLLIAMIAQVFQVRRIIYHPRRQRIVIQWRNFIQSKSCEVDVESLSAELVGPDDIRLNGKVHTGKTVLILSHREFPDATLKLAVSDSKEDIESSFGLLSKWIGNATTDQTMDTITLEDGQVFHVPRTAYGAGNGVYRGKLRVSPDSITLRRSVWTWVVVGFMWVGGLFGLYMLVHGLEMDGPVAARIFFVLLGGMVGLTFISLGAAFLLEQMNTGFSVDGADGTVTLRVSEAPFKALRTVIPFEEILGIQAVHEILEGEIPTLQCELNLVLKTPAAKRIKLMSHDNLESTYQTAEQLSKLLGCRLFDHRGTP